MARYYASIQGNRGEATRMGSAQSGISGHIRGWDIGARVLVCTNRDGEDVVSISLTPGSNGKGQEKCIWSGTRADYDSLIGEREVRV